MKNTILRVRVAVIDNENVIADTLAEILRQYGYEAKPHYNGESAPVDADWFRPDVVLSDIQIGKIDGIETALRIRKKPAAMQNHSLYRISRGPGALPEDRQSRFRISSAPTSTSRGVSAARHEMKNCARKIWPDCRY
jgi:CheY-like chemotaxis protein